MKGSEARLKQNKKGFTLVELLVVIGIIGILFAVILIAVDPARRFSEARNAVRRQDVRDIVEAVLEFMTDNRGNFPTNLDTVTASYQILGTHTAGCNAAACGQIQTSFFASSCGDLSASLVETYLSDIPFDPGTGTSGNTRYAINRTAGSRIDVVACDAELGVATINAKR